MMELLGVGVLTGVASYAVVGQVRRHALQVELLDHPSERSSHEHPTPRGGGLGVIAAALGGILLGGGHLGVPLLAALTGVVLVAFIGWRDDHVSLPARVRFVVHLLAGVAVGWFAGATPGPLGITGLLATAWWIFWSVAAINVTNFMDGIDGLIGGQMLVWGLHLVLLSNATQPTAAMGASLAGASAGFLLWNWAPARIFLGDVGSGSLGLLAVIGGIAAMMVSRWPLELVFLPLLPMFLDATVTLVRRHRKGARVWEAHREHFYQRLAKSGWGHARVSVLFGVLAALGVGAAHLTMRCLPIAALVYSTLVLGIGITVEYRLQRAQSPEGPNAPSP